MHEQHTLNSLRKGQRAVITGIEASDGLRHRLQAMGLRTGREAEIIRQAHLGGPLHVRVGNVHLIMRRADARRVSVHTAA